MVTDNEYEYQEGYADEMPQEKRIPLEDLINNPNIADELSEDTLRYISNKAMRQYKIDKDSRSHREDNMAAAMKLALAITEPKTWPWPNASNVVFPMITRAALEHAKRMAPALLGDGKKVTKGIVIGSDDGLALIDQMTGQVMPAIDPMTGMPVVGADGQPQPMWIIPPGAKKERIENVSDYMDWQFNFQFQSWKKDTRRMSFIRPVTGNVFRKMFYNEDLGRPDAKLVLPNKLVVNYSVTSLTRAPCITEEFELYDYEIIEAIRAGIFLGHSFASSKGDDEGAKTEREKSASEGEDVLGPYNYLEQHARFDLDQDGYPEPYIVTLHQGLGKVVRIVANFQQDRIERVNRKVRKVTPETHYVHYGFLPSFDGGFYDMGYGELLLGLNKAANGLINRMSDAGTLASTSTGFIARGIRMQGGSLRVKPGEFSVVDTKGMSLKDNIVPFQHTQPSPVLMELLAVIQKAGEDIGNISNITSEEMAKMAGVSIMQVVEQEIAAFKEIYLSTRESLDEEIKLLFRLNSLYLEDEAYFNVLDKRNAIAKKDFSMLDMDIVPASSADALTETQTYSRAQMYMQLMQDPFTNQVELRTRFWDAMNEDDSEKLITEPQPQPDPMVQITAAQVENERMKAENDRYDKQVKAAKAEADIAKVRADTIKSLAEAEAVEKGQQMDSYRMQAEHLQTGHEMGMREAEFHRDRDIQERELKQTEEKQEVSAG